MLEGSLNGKKVGKHELHNKGNNSGDQFEYMSVDYFLAFYYIDVLPKYPFKYYSYT